jgi:hypothetical protein
MKIIFLFLLILNKFFANNFFFFRDICQILFLDSVRMPIILKTLVLNEIIELNPKFLKIFDDFYDIGL